MITAAATAKRPMDQQARIVGGSRRRLDDSEIAPEDVPPQCESQEEKNYEDDDEEENDDVDVVFERSVSITANRGVYKICSTLSRTYSHDFFVWGVDAKVSFQPTNSSSTSRSDPATKVGSLEGYLLRCTKGVHFVADSVRDETVELATMFCERNGAITRVETGIDDDDVYGNLIHIYTVEVEEEHRGKCDLGLHLVHHTLEFLQSLKQHDTSQELRERAANAKDNDSKQFYQRLKSCMPQERWGWAIALMVPNVGSTAADETSLQRHFARMGFRQTGKNVDQWLAFYLTASQFASSRDGSIPETTWKTKAESEQINLFVPPKYEATGADKELRDFVSTGGAATNLVRSHRVQEVITIIRYILANRGASIHGARALHAAAARDSYNAEFLQILANLGGDVNAADENGDTPLHVAASMKDPETIAYLIRLGASKMSLNTTRESPLDTLSKSVRNELDMFCMFDLPQSVSQILKRHRANVLLMASQLPPLLIDGWLPPRMRYMLSVTAEDEAMLIDDDSRSFESRKPMPLDSVFREFFRGIRKSDFFPPDVLHQNPGGLYKSFCDGWGDIWQAITSLLNNNQAPTVQRIYQEIEMYGHWKYDKNKFQYFLEKGGKVEHALDALIISTIDLVENGDGFYDYDKNDVEALPKTTLDVDYDLARVKLIGLQEGGEVLSMGPYEHRFDTNGRYQNN